MNLGTDMGDDPESGEGYGEPEGSGYSKEPVNNTDFSFFLCLKIISFIIY